MNDERMEALKAMYQNIPVPTEISQAIRAGVTKGRLARRRRNRRRLAVAASVLIFVGGLTTALNLSPAFAEKATSLPLVGSFVKALIFNDAAAEGGVITDGLSLDDFHWERTDSDETLAFTFEGEGQTGHYEIHADTSPWMLTFKLSGVRKFDVTPAKAIADKSPLIADIFPVTTLDDSMITLVVQFDELIVFEVVERESPAQLALTVSKAPGETVQEAYRVVSVPMAMGEPLGRLEEQLIDYGHRRVYRVEEGLYVIELNRFETIDEAKRLLNALPPSMKSMFTVVLD